MPAQSHIYEGFVRHRRIEPARHEFRASIFMMYLDLDELSTVFRGRWFWSVERFNAATFRRRDHVGDPSVALSDTIRNLVESATSSRPQGAIRLLTHLSYFGYCFNPLSLYFCFDADEDTNRGEERLHSIVAEVTNTPWGERHCYVMRVASSLSGVESAQGATNANPAHQAGILDDAPVTYSFRFPKVFHVSPFMEMDVEYRWLLKGPGKNLVLQTENWRNGQSYFDATLVMRKCPITTLSLASALMRYPLITLQVIANIHWQALWLWWKKVPYVPHPKTCPTEDPGKNTPA